MSDPNLSVQRQIQALQSDLERLRKADVSSICLPWSQRALNPMAASTAWGDQAQPWAANLIVWQCSVFVAAPNNGTNFWTLTLTDAGGAPLATLSTAAITAGQWTRLSTSTITQPSTSNPVLTITTTTTLAPGVLYIVPALALLRTGN